MDDLTRVLDGQRRLEKKLSVLTAMVAAIIQQEIYVMQELDELTTQVEENATVEGSALVLIQGLAEQILASAGDPAAVRALSARLKSSATALAAAVSANTPPIQ